jgi:hypothetical protein
MIEDPVNLRSLLRLVMPFAPRCPEVVAAYNLRLAAIELCERARVWRYMTQMEITENHFEITDIPEYGQIHQIDRARMKGAIEDLQPLPSADAALEETQGYLLSDDMDFTVGDDVPTQAPPAFYSQHIPGKLSLKPFSTGTITLSLWLKPYLDKTAYVANAAGQIEDSYDRVPGYIVSQHGQTLADGALARVLMHTKTEYADPALAQVKAVAAERGIRNAIGSSFKGQQRAPARTRTLWF